MKNPNVRQSPITRDTLIIKDVDTGVKRSVPKLLLECSTRQLHNEMIAPPDQGGLQGARHHTSNDVIISDTMLRSLVPPELRPMTDRHKIMCGCTICYTSKYLQTSLNAWRRKQMKDMEVQANASRSRSKASLLEAYTSYADFFPPTTNLVIHLVKMQLILCCVPQQLHTAYPSGNVFFASANHVRQLLFQHSSLILPAQPP
eukprot:scaffold79890_cov67-Attheya_sp.AAC.1